MCWAGMVIKDGNRSVSRAVGQETTSIVFAVNLFLFGSGLYVLRFISVVSESKSAAQASIRAFRQQPRLDQIGRSPTLRLSMFTNQTGAGVNEEQRNWTTATQLPYPQNRKHERTIRTGRSSLRRHLESTLLPRRQQASRRIMGQDSLSLPAH